MKIGSIKNGNGIQYILNEAYKILGNPILIHDMEYKLIDCNKNILVDDPIWIEFVSTGTVSNNWLEFFKNECFIESAANTKKVTFLISDSLKYPRIYGKLFNKDKLQVGCACMVAYNKPFEDQDPEIFEMICDTISEEFGRTEYYQKYGQMYFDILIKELIHGIEDKELYAAHIESIYMHLKNNIYLAVVDFSKCNSEHSSLEYYRNLFKHLYPSFKYAIYLNYIIIMISTDNNFMNIKKELRCFKKIFEKDNIYMGISSCFYNLYELPKYYNEAIDKLNLCKYSTNFA